MHYHHGVAVERPVYPPIDSMVRNPNGFGGPFAPVSFGVAVWVIASNIVFLLSVSPSIGWLLSDIFH